MRGSGKIVRASRLQMPSGGFRKDAPNALCQQVSTASGSAGHAGPAQWQEKEMAGGTLTVIPGGRHSIKQSPRETNGRRDAHFNAGRAGTLTGIVHFRNSLRGGTSNARRRKLLPEPPSSTRSQKGAGRTLQPCPATISPQCSGVT